MQKTRLEGTHHQFLNNVRAIELVYEQSRYGMQSKLAKLHEYKERIENAKFVLSEQQVKSIVRGIKALQLPIQKNYGAHGVIGLHNHIRRSIGNLYGVRQRAVDQAIVGLAIAIEQYIRMVIYKYYEDDKRRLKRSTASLSDEELIDGLDKRTVLWQLREKRVEELTHGSIEDWFTKLEKEVGIEISIEPEVVRLFLVRHSIVHNGRRAVRKLSRKYPQYQENMRLRIDESDYEAFIVAAHTMAKRIRKSYTKTYPI